MDAPPALPPQMFTTSAQLLDLTDRIAELTTSFYASKEKLLVSLRDGRKFIGVLRTWDQYANLVLQDTVERVIVDDMYCDIKRGVFIVRGENVLLLGEIDLDKEDFLPYRSAPHKEVFARQLELQQEKKRKEKAHKKKLLQLGFETETEITGL